MHNPNAASPRGQFTLSYRLLPFSGRSLVGTLPKIGSGQAFAYPRNASGRSQLDAVTATRSMENRAEKQ
jgi:hypothetical protein